jgi:uncharacterized protein YggE
MKRYFIALILGLGLLCAEGKNTLSTFGEASISTTPDVVYVTIGVQRDGLTAKEAQDALKRDIGKVLDALTSRELVLRENISTDQYLLYPIYRKKKIENQDVQETNEETLLKYRGSISLRCTVTQIAKLADLLDATVSSGANKIENVDFTVADQKPAKDEALRQAIANAQNKAQLIAEKMNVKLGKPISISESYYPAPYRAKSFMLMDANTAAQPLPSGMSEITARVDVVYEID